jgi:exodeoxyribonuclease-3
MKIATWNVNSIRARIEHVEKFLKEENPEILCIQETKVQNADFPVDNLKKIGYFSVFSGQKSYNGVAVLSKVPFKNFKTDLFDTNGQKRTMELTANGLTIINGYYPRGGKRGEDAFFFKLEFFEKMRSYLATNHSPMENIVLCGDFNVAIDENDVWDPEFLQSEVGFLKEERDAIKRLMDFGLVDIFRKFHEERAFTWWDYRGGAFRRNEGMRIDYILSTKLLSEKAKNCEIKTTYRKLKKPSDHAPVLADFELS